MAILRANRTIPELFEFLTENYGRNNPKPLMSRKINDQYVGISYREFREETERFAMGLAALGIKREDKAAIIAENRPEWVYSDMALLGLGAIDVPIYPSLTADSIEFILNNSESKAVIVSNKLQLNKIFKIRDNCKHLQFIIVMNEKDVGPDQGGVYTFKEVQEMGIIYSQNRPSHFRNEIRKANENSVCTIIYTSGTTGEPKGVMLSHKNILSNVNAALEAFPITKDDMFLSFLPLCHIFERMGGYYTAFSAGASIYYADSIDTVSQNLIEAKPTLITTVPRLFEKIYSKIIKNVESQPVPKQKIFHWAIKVGKEYAQAVKKREVSFVLSSKKKIADKLVFKKIREKTGGRLRFFISGGAALSKDLGEFFEAAGIKILEGYGLTESSPVIAANRDDNYKFGTVGHPLPGVEVKIASDGEIIVRGPNVMLGYYKNIRETNEVIKDGWLHTGDIGHLDPMGFLHITDRKKHLFKTSSGKYIAPTPIES
ncbi:MAG: long-chain fatty acid--CoA ligase, partial [Ignavibacteriaceae bacterium]